MADARTRETALITFLATAANVTLLGVGGAFWGLVAGLTAHLLIHGGHRTLIGGAAKP
ncbi:Inner membrane protein YdcO [compost metagenome]